MAVATHRRRLGLHPGTEVAALVLFGAEPGAEPVAVLLLTVQLASGKIEAGTGACPSESIFLPMLLELAEETATLREQLRSLTAI